MQCSKLGLIRSLHWRLQVQGELDPPPVPGNELLCNVGQIITDDLRLWADWQNIIADSLDKRRFPAGRDGAKRVPCVAGDKTQLRGLNAEFLFYMGVNLGCRLVALHAVHAKEPFEKIDDAAMFQLASLYLNQVIRESEQPEACSTQLG